MASSLSKAYIQRSSVFHESTQKLYNLSQTNQVERYSQLLEGLAGDIMFFSSPGRVELIGNHTDHNNGKVIATTINLDTIAAATKTHDNNIIIKSKEYDDIKLDIHNLEVSNIEYGTSLALVKGVLKGFADRKLNYGGFIANTSSNIFKGAGVSSSAAFELLICEILDVLYNNNSIKMTTKAQIAQYSENIHFGKPSGLMDQLTIAKGGVSLMDFEKELSPNIYSVDWPFKDLSIIIVNCGGDHSQLIEEYAEIREDMTSIANAIGKKVLQEVAEQDFYNNIRLLQRKCGGRAILRAKHFLEENKRVERAWESIKNKDTDAFLECIDGSGDSSYQQLQNCFIKGDKEQSVALGIHLAKKSSLTKAVRVHGGGFAGTILAITEERDALAFMDFMANFFKKENIFKIAVRSSGVARVEV